MCSKIIQRLKPSFSFRPTPIFINTQKGQNRKCKVHRLHTVKTYRYNNVTFYYWIVLCFNLMLVFEFTEVRMVSSIKHGCKQQEYSMLLQLPCDFTLTHLPYITSLSCIPKAQAGITFGFMHSTHYTVENLLHLTINPQRKRWGKRRKTKFIPFLVVKFLPRCAHF